MNKLTLSFLLPFIVLLTGNTSFSACVDLDSVALENSIGNFKIIEHFANDLNELDEGDPREIVNENSPAWIARSTTKVTIKIKHTGDSYACTGPLAVNKGMTKTKIVLTSAHCFQKVKSMESLKSIQDDIESIVVQVFSPNGKELLFSSSAKLKAIDYKLLKGRTNRDMALLVLDKWAGNGFESPLSVDFSESLSQIMLSEDYESNSEDHYNEPYITIAGFASAIKKGKVISYDSNAYLKKITKNLLSGIGYGSPGTSGAGAVVTVDKLKGEGEEHLLGGIYAATLFSEVRNENSSNVADDEYSETRAPIVVPIEEYQGMISPFLDEFSK